MSVGLVAALLLANCGGSSTPTPSAQAGAAPNGGGGTVPPSPPSGSWLKMKNKTTCEAMQNEFCVGFFGLSVAYSGEYSVGPTPEGVMLNGQITPDELIKLRSEADLVASGNTQGPPACIPSSSIPGLSDLVTLVLPDSSSVQVFSQSASSICFLNDVAADRQLQADLSSLTNKYYPRPFPKQTSSIPLGAWGGPKSPRNGTNWH